MSTPTAAETVTVYWRPGCPYCSRLRRGLSRAGLRTNAVNTLADPEAAATVRRFAGGNETVPTVVVGDIARVNPSVGEVLALAGESPAAWSDVASVSAGTPARGSLGTALGAIQCVLIVALIMASLAVESLGHPAWSWGLDGVAVVVYLTFRILRARIETTPAP